MPLLASRMPLSRLIGGTVNILKIDRPSTEYFQTFRQTSSLSMVEMTGLEPATSGLQNRRSPS